MKKIGSFTQPGTKFGTGKELLDKGKHNMIIWCLSDNKNAFKFYEVLGGVNVETKEAKIGDEYYKEYGFYFDLEIVIFCTPNNV